MCKCWVVAPNNRMVRTCVQVLSQRLVLTVAFVLHSALVEATDVNARLGLMVRSVKQPPDMSRITDIFGLTSWVLSMKVTLSLNLQHNGRTVCYCTTARSLNVSICLYDNDVLFIYIFILKNEIHLVFPSRSLYFSSSFLFFLPFIYNSMMLFSLFS